jgi:hypothetical protein
MSSGVEIREGIMDLGCLCAEIGELFRSHDKISQAESLVTGENSEIY